MTVARAKAVLVHEGDNMHAYGELTYVHFSNTEAATAMAGCALPIGMRSAHNVLGSARDTQLLEQPKRPDAAGQRVMPHQDIISGAHAPGSVC